MKSSQSNFILERWDALAVQRRFSPRTLERRLGEDVVALNEAKYVILGIEEAVGPKANYGNNGAQFAFEAFCTKFLSMQSTNDFTAKNVCFVGAVKQVDGFSDVQKSCAALVPELDEFVFDVLTRLLRSDQIPIVIGGGHNNALPLIRFAAKTKKSALNVVNLDAHADYRPLNERHSGNPFSFAYEEGVLNNYSVFGLHKRYNAQAILDGLSKDRHWFSFAEDYIDELLDWSNDFNERFTFLNGDNVPVGIELDLDTIERMPSSAFTPFGISATLARKYVRKFAALNNIAYLHLPEGAPLSDLENSLVGKMLAYLVTDFIEKSNC